MSLQSSPDSDRSKLPPIGELSRSPDAVRATFLERYREPLLRLAEQEQYGRPRAKVGASDIVQMTLIEAVRDLERFRGATEAELVRWLERALRQNCLDAFRTHQRRGEVGLPDAMEPPARERSPSSILMLHEDADLVHAALRKLPKDYQLALTMREFDGASFDEIGKSLDRTAGAARMLWVRALDRLKELLEPGE